MWYSTAPGAYGIWGISDLGNLDLLGYNVLTLHIRGESGCDSAVKMRDSASSASPEVSRCEAEVRLGAYSPLTSTWTAVTVPLEHFRLAEPARNLWLR